MSAPPEDHSFALLKVAGRDMPLTGDYTVRFVDRPGMTPLTVLYHCGRRVTAEWELILTASAAPDAAGANGNTAEVG
jgi:hypothetical protein